MREIESKPIPTLSKGLAGDLRRLKKPTDSFLIENKGLKRAVLYSTASRLGIKIITRQEAGGLRVWRNFDAESGGLTLTGKPVTKAECVARINVPSSRYADFVNAMAKLLPKEQPTKRKGK